MSTIKQLRESKGWTQQELADKMGVAVATVSRLENGVHPPQKTTLILLALAFGIDPQELIDEYRTKKEAVNE